MDGTDGEMSQQDHERLVYPDGSIRHIVTDEINVLQWHGNAQWYFSVYYDGEWIGTYGVFPSMRQIRKRVALHRLGV